MIDLDGEVSVRAYEPGRRGTGDHLVQSLAFGGLGAVEELVHDPDLERHHTFADKNGNSMCHGLILSHVVYQATVRGSDSATRSMP